MGGGSVINLRIHPTMPYKFLVSFFPSTDYESVGIIPDKHDALTEFHCKERRVYGIMMTPPVKKPLWAGVRISKKKKKKFQVYSAYAIKS